MKRLRKSDIRKLSERLPFELDWRAVVETDGKVILVDKKLWYFMYGEEWVPALPLLMMKPALLPAVVVDMGAVPHVVKGADIMRPGVVEIPEADKGSLVVVVDERNRKPLVVAKLLLSGAEARTTNEGKACENLHFVGDKLWKEYIR